MKKRGQVDQLFIFIFALVVAGVIIILGYLLITKLVNLGGEVETIKFERELEKQINLYYTFSPGTSGNLQIRTPSDIKGICFLDSGDINDIEYKDVIDTARILKGDYNVYFSTVSDKIAEPIKINKLKPEPDPLCISTLRGVLDFDLINQGDFVSINKHE